MTSIRFVFGRLGRSVWSFLRRDSGSALFFFFIAVVLRAIPELLVPSYPVGYETITWYAPPLLSFAGRGVLDVFASFFRAGPLFYLLAWLAVNATGAHAFVVLKVFGPLLYGCLLVSFFVFARRGLKLDWKLAFVASLLLVFQIAALRESWDRFRTVLGLVFVFSALTVLKSEGFGRRKWRFVGFLAVLAALSREYVAVMLFVTVLGFAFWEKRDRLSSLLALGPALAIILAVVYPDLFRIVFSYVPEAYYQGRGYFWIVEDAFLIFALCYVGILPFVVLGRRDKLLNSMVGCLFLGSFSVVLPWFSVPGYQRWLMLLVFPFCIYAALGFERLHLFSGRRVWALTAVLMGFVIVGAGYSSGLFSYVGNLPNSYVAVNLVQSSIGWNQVNDVKAVLVWLDRNAAFNSSVLAEEGFYGWTLIYLGRAGQDVTVIPYGAASSPMPALETALSDGFSRVYLIWFSGQSVSGFDLVHFENAIAVFQYASKTV
jgi:hypothetical protein